jgi:Tfp pilus assembly protein FimT
MKRVVLAIAAALVLIALPAFAQYTDPSTTTQPSTTTTTPSSNLDTSATTTTETTTSTVPVQEERTNPQVPTHGPSSGLTASGSVISWNTDEVVLRTATGMTHFKLLPNTTGVTTGFTEGQRVTIDFTRNEQGVLIAQQIRPEGTTATTTTPGAVAAGDAVAGAASNVAEAVEEGVEETVGADVDNDGAVGTRGGTSTDTASTETTTTMPATGSKAPLAGLLGLLALGGAAALRRL